MFNKGSIEFILNEQDGKYSLSEIAKPYPASKNLPDWYVKAETRLGDSRLPLRPSPMMREESVMGSFKACAPFFDAMSAGYILPLWADVVVDAGPRGAEFSWKDMHVYNYLGSHDEEQVEGIPNVRGTPLKFLTPWSIVTPPGYSVLITNPFNRFEERFEAFTGIIDSDTYNLSFNMPFMWKDNSFKGILKEGTPLCQIIPFKRESFSSKFSELTGVREVKQRKQHFVISRSAKDGYKKKFWSRKVYK